MAARPPPRRMEDTKFNGLFWGVNHAFRFDPRQSKWRQLEGVGDLIFFMFFPFKIVEFPMKPFNFL